MENAIITFNSACKPIQLAQTSPAPRREYPKQTRQELPNTMLKQTLDGGKSRPRPPKGDGALGVKKALRRSFAPAGAK